MRDRLLTLAEMADALRVSRRTAVRLKDNGTIASFKIGRLVRFRESDIMRFIETGVPAYRTKRPTQK